MSESTDHQILRKASFKVGIRITAACAIMVLGVIVAAGLYMGYQGRHPPLQGSGTMTEGLVYIESNDMLKAMVVAGLAGIIVAGAIGWLSARRAIAPLSEALALQRRFVQDASHELRTPLAILDARVQLALRNPDAGPGVQSILKDVRHDATVLAGTLDELLLAATDTGAAPVSVPTDLSATVSAAVADLQQLAGQREVALSFTPDNDGGAAVPLQAASIRRAVVALVDNAVAHTQAGGRVEVRTKIQGRQAVLTVTDTGSGIHGVDQKRIFDRFVRTQVPVASGQRSFGLGLALVREIAEAAGGGIKIAATGPAGTTMAMTLPLAEAGELPQ